jgi:hypothetical protein
MTATITPPAADDRQRPGPKEILGRMSMEMHQRIRKQEGMTLSRWLEQEDPSERYKDGTDAFQRLLMVADIKTRSHPRGEYTADTVEKFHQSEATRALFPEFLLRTVEKVRHSQQRAPFLSDDTAVNSQMRPYGDDMTPRWDMTEPAIPLDEVVARTRFVDSDRARSTYLTRDATQTRKKRVSEAADIPRAKIVTSENTIPLYKYGVGIETSYEALRRLPIDLVAFFIRLEAIQAETDKVAAALDVIVNGDGNSGTSATSYNLTTLDGAAVAGTLTLKGWLAFKAKFASPYTLTTALAPEAMILQLLLLNMGSANALLMDRPDLGGFTPINNTFADGVRYGITSDAPANKIVGIDGRFGIGRVVETGSQVEEIERYMSRQVQTLFITENEGFEVIDPRALKILVVNA